MKQCTTCHKEKEPTEFNVRQSEPDGRQPRCRQCCKEYYAANRASHIARVAVNKTNQIKSNQKRVNSYLRAHPCVDCGEKDLIVLEFDHIKDSKDSNVSQLYMGSWTKLKKEIDKCVVRCANCHRRKTYKERGWDSRSHTLLVSS